MIPTWLWETYRSDLFPVSPEQVTYVSFGTLCCYRVNNTTLKPMAIPVSYSKHSWYLSCLIYFPSFKHVSCLSHIDSHEIQKLQSHGHIHQSDRRDKHVEVVKCEVLHSTKPVLKEGNQFLYKFLLKICFVLQWFASFMVCISKKKKKCPGPIS